MDEEKAAIFIVGFMTALILFTGSLLVFDALPRQIRDRHQRALVQRGLAVYSADDMGNVKWHWKDHPEDITIEPRREP